MARSKWIATLRAPFTGDQYTAEDARRIRVEHDGKVGYFDDCGRWLEGELRSADPCYCRFLSSSWVIAQDPERFGLSPRAHAAARARREPADSSADHRG